jgi:uncharacterized protein
MTNQTAAFTPTAPSERLMSLDVLRGFAVLGILIMNIQSFSMIEAAYINPAAYGDLTGLNKLIWILSHLFADQKFMTIFSIMFGAGIALMTSKIEAKGQSSAGLHYRRTFWLLIIGLIHAYVFWHGDILVSYALCALLAFLFRKLSPKKLLIVGIILIAVSSLLYFLSGLTVPFWDPETYQGTMASWKPGPEIIAKEISAFRGNWLEQMTIRAPSSLKFQTFLFLFWTGWRAGGLMLIGMALYKWGILTNQRSKRFYLISMCIGFVIGIPIVGYGMIRNFSANWLLDFSMFFGWQYNCWGSLFIAFGYICLIMIICKSMKVQKITSPFAAVGRMALTNYLLQTIICTIIFYGHGLGLFGHVERKNQILIVIAVWLIQLIISPVWLRYFRFGPAEWLWRSLTYLKLQPMKN